MKLSLIIPVYNVEKYLWRCLNSCFLQTVEVSMFEVIIVNDGSPDNCDLIIKSFMERNHNIKYIQQENRGLSAARNVGLSLAEGDFVWFIDSDDWIVEDAISQIFPLLNATVDLIALNTLIIYENTGIENEVKRSIDISEFTGKYLYNKSLVYPYTGAQFYVINKSFLIDNNIHFAEGIIYEDLLFFPILMSKAQNCRIIAPPIYNYSVRNNSITTSKSSKTKCMDMLFVSDALYKRDRNEKMFLIMIALICGSLYRNCKRLVHQEREMIAKELFKRKYVLWSIIKIRRFKMLFCYFKIVVLDRFF